MTSIRYLQRPDGRIAYDVQGDDGPLVICVPAMAELRQTFRLLAPMLVDAGYRVATMDLRGHGDSDATFPAYDDVALASDLLALVDELGEPAFLVGNSMGAGAAVIVAADAPTRVRGLALLGPFVRDAGGAAQKALLRALFVRPWGPAVLHGYYPKWLPGTKPEGYEEHRQRVYDNLRRPGHWRAFVQTSRTSHEPARRRLPAVQAPAVVVMGTADVDWADPAAEAEWIGAQLRAEVIMVPEVGHYPQVQAPDVVASAVTRLVERASRT